MMREERHLTIPGQVDRVPVARAFVAEAAQRAGLDERAAHHCQLVVDEACTNVVEHGYLDNPGEHSLDVICRCEDDQFSITVCDDGPAFNPLTRDDPDPNAPLEERELGGWGIFFIKKLMDEVIYRYENGRNSLTMIKHARPASAQRSPHPRMVSATQLPPNIWVVTPFGRLDSQFSPTVDQVASEKIGDRQDIIFDLSHVDYVSSTGLKTLVSLWQRAHAKRGELVLTSVHARVTEVMAIVGLDSVFSVYPDVAAASSALALRAR
jgi:anti-anti-sigma factor